MMEFQKNEAQGNLEAVRRHAKIWTIGDKPHVAATRWRSTTSAARVDRTCSPSRMISGSRCRAKLHGIFKNAQRGSTDGRFILLLGGSDPLVGNQIARLSSFGVVILSEVLSPGFDLNSPIVRYVLRDWIAHGDVAAVWMTRPLALSTVSCRLEACH